MDGASVQVASDGTVVYRASALGGCQKALLAARLEYEPLPPPKSLQLAYDRGHAAEDVVVKLLRDQGIPVGSPQLEVELTVSARILVRGHVDGVQYLDAEVPRKVRRRVVEVKSQNKEEYARFDRQGWESGFFPRYKWQQSVYMHALSDEDGVPASLMLARVMRDDEGFVVPESLDVSYVDEPFYSVAQIRERVLKVEAASASGVLIGDCAQEFGCPYYYLHDEVDRTLVTDEAVEKLAFEHEEAKRDEVAAKGRKEAARRALRAALDDDKNETEHGVKITFWTQKNPPSLDRGYLDAFLKVYGKTFADFTSQSDGERMKITLPKEQTDDGDTQTGRMGDD